MREKEEIVVYSNEREEEEERVNNEPQSVCGDRVLVMLLVD